jgi:hypothetical protein
MRLIGERNKNFVNIVFRFIFMGKKGRIDFERCGLQKKMRWVKNLPYWLSGIVIGNPASSLHHIEGNR